MPATNLFLVSVFFIALFSVSTIYWLERKEGYSHAASVKCSLIMVALLFGNAVVGYVVNVAQYS